MTNMLKLAVGVIGAFAIIQLLATCTAVDEYSCNDLSNIARYVA